MQPGMQLAFLAGKLHCWFVFNLMFTRTSRSYLQNCFPVRAQPVLWMGLFLTRAGLGASLGWTSWGSPWPISPAWSPVYWLLSCFDIVWNLQREHPFPLSSSMYRHCTVLLLVGTSEVLHKEVAAICSSDPESPLLEPEGSDFPPSFLCPHSVDLSPISLWIWFLEGVD